MDVMAMKFVMAMATAWLISGCRSTDSPAQPVPIRKPEFSLAFSNFTPGDAENSPPIPNSVYVTITKNDEEAGTVHWSKIQPEGSRIGWDERASPSTSVHQVWSRKKGKTVLVDFDTGCVIKSIAVGKHIPVTFRRCPTLTWPPRCPGPQIEKGHAQVNEVHYADAQGNPMQYQSRKYLLPSDDLCVLHTGDPKTWRVKEAHEAREQAAAVMLALADDNWLSRNPRVKKQAQEMFRKILKDFARDAPMAQNLNRIKLRAEADLDE